MLEDGPVANEYVQVGHLIGEFGLINDQPRHTTVRYAHM